MLPSLGLGEIACLCEQACLMEASARKPGNVHPEASFADLCYQDFVTSAKCVAGPLSRAGESGVGRAVRDAIRATRVQVQTNTNLGIALLLAPLAAVPANEALRDGVPQVLRSLTREDSQYVYEAIQLAHPGGLGSVKEGDVTGPPPDDLLWAMGLAADRDWIAKQYVTGFRDVLETGVTLLSEWRPDAHWEVRVVHLYLEFLVRWPDSLIVRKCGPPIAKEASERARAVLEAGWPDGSNAGSAIEALDHWLRGDRHRRNPGTTADAVAATLFAALRDGRAEFADWK